jgi:hypothetical protein
MLRHGLRLFGTIRKRIAHRLHVELSKADEDAFLAVEIFRYFRIKSNKRYPPDSQPQNELESALPVLEDFGEFATGMFHSAVDPNTIKWDDIMSDEERETLSERVNAMGDQ